MQDLNTCDAGVEWMLVDLEANPPSTSGLLGVDMITNTTEEKILAHALYEIRTLLSSYLGSENSGPIEVRVAAHLAYALHNEAIAVGEGRSFDVNAALAKVAAIDTILNTEDGSKFSRYVSSGKL